ncbi:MAG: fused MFS/spermidine synthase [Flavobacteriales bacterium]
MSKKIITFLFLTFLEGFLTMSTEIGGGMILKPFWGNAHTIWGIILGTSIAAITLGYFAGGYFTRFNIEKITLYMLCTASLMVSIVSFYYKPLQELFIQNYSVITGSCLSAITIIFIPLFMLGSTIPLIIQIVGKEQKDSGGAAGNVFAISTIGGIFGAFITGFEGIPLYGAENWFMYTGLLFLIVFSIIFILYNVLIGFSYLISSILLFFISYVPLKKDNGQKFEVIEKRNGIMGEVKVVDIPYPNRRGFEMGRALMVNNTIQTVMSLKRPQLCMDDWAHFFPAAVSMYPKNSKALLLGMGGGTIIKQFNKLGFNTDVIELDRRIARMAKKYFHLPGNSNLFIDDARHYIKTTNKKYDIITCDLFHAESPPSHLMTVESFNEMKELLSDKGCILLDIFGPVQGKEGIAIQSIITTMKKTGLKVQTITTPGSTYTRNIIIIASKKGLDLKKVNYKTYKMPRVTELSNRLLKGIPEGKVLKDNKLEFNYLYNEIAMKWRKRVNRYYTVEF